MKRTAGHAAFTLIELIVATTATVLVTGSTAVILRTTSAARERVNCQMDLQLEARHAVNTVATALHNACRTGAGQTVLEGVNGWCGEMPADRVRLFTVSGRTVRRGQPESDVRECEFFLSEPTGEAPPGLMQRTDPTRNEAPDGGGVVRRVAGNILCLDLAYHDGVQWVDDWTQDRRAWPMAVRIRLAVLIEKPLRKVWTTGRIVNFPRRPQQRNTAGNGAEENR